MEIEKMTRLFSMECCGGNGNFDGAVHITSEKYEALDEKIKNNISYKAQEYLCVIRHIIEIEWTKEYEQEKRQENISELTKLFADAGFETIHVKVIDNQYSADACYYTNPWLIVTTRKGPITIGWRKRVINLDWSDSDITADGRELFKNEKTTKDKYYIHCWSKNKAIEYLKKLLVKGKEND